MWYFTSPGAGSTGPSALALELVEQIAGGLPMMLTSTLRRPRWAMPMTISLNALLPARWIISSIIGIRLSPPSSEKRFWPTYLCAGSAPDPRQCSSSLRCSTAQVESGALAFQPFLNPALLGRLVDVHVLGADRADVHIAQQTHDLAQVHCEGATSEPVLNAAAISASLKP
jgi:hypothetical protein